MSEEIDRHVLRKCPRARSCSKIGLGRYEIVQKLGRGAYGIVWKAIDKKTREVRRPRAFSGSSRPGRGSEEVLRRLSERHGRPAHLPRDHVPAGFSLPLASSRLFGEELNGHENIVRLLNVLKADNDQDIYLICDYMESDLHAVIRANILEEIHKQPEPQRCHVSRLFRRFS